MAKGKFTTGAPSDEQAPCPDIGPASVIASARLLMVAVRRGEAWAITERERVQAMVIAELQRRWVASGEQMRAQRRARLGRKAAGGQLLADPA